MDYFDTLRRQLDNLKQRNLLRCLRTVISAQGPVVRLAQRPDNELVLFCSNNYLNLAAHPAVTAAVASAAEKYGYASGASRLISGTMQPHVELEDAFAQFLRKEAALLFPSGWTANEAVLTTLPQKGDLVLIDKFDHASIIDAVRSHDIDFRVYRREQIHKLERLLACPDYNHKFIVTESVFSMDGNSPDLATLVRLKKEHNAILILDEAHSIGCFGPAGAGLAEQMGLLDEIDVIIAPLGKAFGASGAVVAAKQIIKDYLINKARPFVYTTAPSPVNCAAVMAALNIVQNDTDRRNRLHENASWLRTKLTELNLDIGHSTSQIIPVILGDEATALSASEQLLDRGFLIPAIRPPTVPKGTARLRISVMCDHTQEQLQDLVDALAEILQPNTKETFQ